SQDIQFGDAFRPPWVDVTIVDPGAQCEMTLSLEHVNKIPACTAIKIRSTDPGWSISGKELHAINLDELIRYVFRAVSYRVVDRSGSRTVVEGRLDGPPSGWGSATGRKGRGVRAITPEFLEEVAQVYRDNVSGNPTQAVGRGFGVSLRMAGVYVQKAR